MGTHRRVRDEHEARYEDGYGRRLGVPQFGVAKVEQWRNYFPDQVCDDGTCAQTSVRLPRIVRVVDDLTLRKGKAADLSLERPRYKTEEEGEDQIHNHAVEERAVFLVTILPWVSAARAPRSQRLQCHLESKLTAGPECHRRTYYKPRNIWPNRRFPKRRPPQPSRKWLPLSYRPTWH